MVSFLSRRAVLAGLATLPAARALAVGSSFSSDADLGLPYLETLAGEPARRGTTGFLAPSQIMPDYSHAIYVNAALRGPAAQKMWVLERRAAGWDLALWDDGYWAEAGRAPRYSWPVSTGRKYPGEARSGPTPLGVFNVDDRHFRHRRGWGAPGMYNSIYIDLHYSGGRASGVAIHGTTKGRYGRLGTADSHGCVRVTQANAEALWALFHGTGKPGESSPLWSESVPRFFKSKPQQNWNARYGYRRDGVPAVDKAGQMLTKPGYRALLIFYRDDLG